MYKFIRTIGISTLMCLCVSASAGDEDTTTRIGNIGIVGETRDLTRILAPVLRSTADTGDAAAIAARAEELRTAGILPAEGDESPAHTLYEFSAGTGHNVLVIHFTYGKPEVHSCHVDIAAAALPEDETPAGEGGILDLRNKRVTAGLTHVPSDKAIAFGNTPIDASATGGFVCSLTGETADERFALAFQSTGSIRVWGAFTNQTDASDPESFYLLAVPPEEEGPLGALPNTGFVVAAEAGNTPVVRLMVPSRTFKGE